MHLLTAGLELYVGSRFGRESRFYLQLLKKKNTFIPLLLKVPLLRTVLLVPKMLNFTLKLHGTESYITWTPGLVAFI